MYRFYNSKERLIYIGKAKNLKKRVRSYFGSSKQHNRKTLRMVSEIARIEFTIVNSEYDALLLEDTLIKQHQPPYNILLKYGNAYPYLCITKERFPRVITTHTTSSKAGEYYGPFTDPKTMYRVLELIKQLYPLRTCKYHLSKENIQRKKFKVCLDYHLGSCLGPCQAKQTEEDYLNNIGQVKQLLKGKFSALKKEYKAHMVQAAKDQAYEQAQAYKEKLDALEAYQAKALVVKPQWGDLDVFSVLSDEQHIFVGYLQIRAGAVSFSETTKIKKKLEETEEQVLPLVIVSFRERYGSQVREILTNVPPKQAIEQLSITVPQIGDKKKLLQLATANALFLKQETLNQKRAASSVTPALLKQLQQDLQLKQAPQCIECFDNSNLQGTHPVASLVCFRKGVPAKKDYRHFHIKTVEGPDDFASMREVVKRRYSHLIQEGAELPDLIIVDGGKGQLSAAVEVLKELEIYGRAAIIGIAKRLEEIYYPGDSTPLHIDRKSSSLKLIQRIRNEAHRFAITFHRKIRSQSSLKSSLSDIKGVGPQTVQKLLEHWKTACNVQKASLESLTSHIGHTRAKLVYEHFQSMDLERKEPLQEKKEH